MSRSVVIQTVKSMLFTAKIFVGRGDPKQAKKIKSAAKSIWVQYKVAKRIAGA